MTRAHSTVAKGIVQTFRDRCIVFCYSKDAVLTITGEMFDNTWAEIEYYPNILRATNCAHVEVS